VEQVESQAPAHQAPHIDTILEYVQQPPASHQAMAITAQTDLQSHQPVPTDTAPTVATVSEQVSDEPHIGLWLIFSRAIHIISIVDLTVIARLQFKLWSI